MQQNEDNDVKTINVNNSTKGRLTNGAFKVFDTVTLMQDELGDVRSELEDMATVSALTETKEELKERADKQEKEIANLKADLQKEQQHRYEHQIAMRDFLEFTKHVEVAIPYKDEYLRGHGFTRPMKLYDIIGDKIYPLTK